MILCSSLEQLSVFLGFFFLFFFICSLSHHAWWIYDTEVAVREKAGKSLSSDLPQSPLVLFYIYTFLPSPHMLLALKFGFPFLIFFSFYFLARPELSFPHILPFFLLDSFSSSSYYLFNPTRPYRFFSPQPSPSPFLLFFLWTLSLPILYYHTVSTQTISRLLSTSVSWKCLSPLNPIKMLFISIMMSHSHQYLKIRTNLSLFFICCSITHNIIMLVSSQSTVEVLKVLFFSCILYLLRT